MQMESADPRNSHISLIKMRRKKCAKIEKCTGITCESSKSCWLNIKSDDDFKKTYTNVR